VEEQFWSLCIAKGITVISRAKSSEQNDDKTNNSDDVILCHSFPELTSIREKEHIMEFCQTLRVVIINLL